MVSQRLVEVLHTRVQDGAFWSQVPYSDRAAYRADAQRLEQVVFKDEALVATGLNGHPKANKAWTLAWDKGHSAGLHEVLDELVTFAELLED